MLDDNYTNKEDTVVDKEAIEFNNWDDDNNGDNEGDDGGNDDNDGGDDYIEVVATTKKKENCPRQGRGISQRGWQTHQSTMIL